MSVGYLFAISLGLPPLVLSWYFFENNNSCIFESLMWISRKAILRRSTTLEQGMSLNSCSRNSFDVSGKIKPL